MAETTTTTMNSKSTGVPSPPATNGNSGNVNGDDGVANSFPSNVHVSQHPILSHKITILRSSTTHCGTFRAVLKELTYHLGYEATRNLSTTKIDISVPTTITTTVGHNNNAKQQHKQQTIDHLEYQGDKLKEKIALIPILRSGLGMVDSMLELLPNAAVHHIGMYKSKGPEDHLPVQYYNRLPRNCQADVAYVLDAVIATASTVSSVVQILKKWGVPKIHVMAVIVSRQGIEQLLNVHPDIEITCGRIDEIVKDGNLLPGLGDSGDRLFGTATFFNDDDDEDGQDDQSLLHPSIKRKRSMSQQSME